VLSISRPDLVGLSVLLATLAGCAQPGQLSGGSSTPAGSDSPPLFSDGSPPPGYDATVPPPPGPDATVPPPPPPGTAFAFFAVGDTRSNPDIAQQNFQSMVQLDPKAVALFNSGDVTADGEVSQWQDHQQAVLVGGGGKIKMDLSSWSSSAIRYFGVIGNHDIHDSDWLANWNANLPGQKGLGTNGSSGVWFSVTYKSALFILLDSEHSTSAQTTWLKQVLANAAADPTIKWKFAFYHAPVYPCNSKSPFSSGIPWVREFEQYKVDMVFNGHAHVYERTCQMVGGKCQQGGVIYVTAGGGGAGTKDVDPTKTDNAGSDSYDCQQILQASKGNWHHYCHIKIDGNTLTYNCYSHDATTNPEDTLTLTK
jgi:hypothetical protein